MYVIFLRNRYIKTKQNVLHAVYMGETWNIPRNKRNLIGKIVIFVFKKQKNKGCYAYSLHILQEKLIRSSDQRKIVHVY